MVEEEMVSIEHRRGTTTIQVHSTMLDISAQKKASRAKAAPAEETSDLLLKVNLLRRLLPTLAISGYPDANRAVIQTSEDETHEVYVEGYGLKDCMNSEGVIGTRVSSNNVMECCDILCIEAARKTIAVEIAKVMREMNIDPRHMELLAVVMTYKGEVLGITRFGMSK